MPLDLFEDGLDVCDDRHYITPLVISASDRPLQHYNLEYEFEKVGISFELSKVLAAHRITIPTPIQHLAIPLLKKQSALIISPTGTGKTLAFLLPAISDLITDPVPFHTVILTPTRELAQQIYDYFMIFSKSFGLYASLVTGGQSVIHSAQQIGYQPYCLIATPGRLCQMLKTQDESVCRLMCKCKFLILDEADLFLESDFDEDIKGVLQFLGTSRRVVLATASETQLILQLAEERKFAVLRSGQPKMPLNLRHCFYILPQNFQASTYAAFFISALTGIDLINKNDGKPMNYKILNTRIRQGIVFAEGAEYAEVLCRTFNYLAMPAVCLHGKMKQDSRWHSIQQFKLGAALLLVATDLAARGLDIYSVDFVVHMTVCSPVMYLHRAGRAGRDGSAAVSYMLVKPQQVLLKEAIESQNGILMEEYTEYVNYCRAGAVERFDEEFLLTHAFHKVAALEVQAKMDIRMENIGDKLYGTKTRE